MVAGEHHGAGDGHLTGHVHANGGRFDHRGWIGVDVGTRAIKLAQVVRDSAGFRLAGRWIICDESQPLLKAILGKMGADEASHGAFFYDLLTKGFKGDLDALAKKVSAVANEFKMPVQNNLLNYRRQLLGMMRAAPSYRHGDVFEDMMKAVERASERYDRESLQLITPDLGPFGR